MLSQGFLLALLSGITPRTGVTVGVTDLGYEDFFSGNLMGIEALSAHVR